MSEGIKIFFSMLCFIIVFIIGYKIVKAEKNNEKDN